MNEKYEIDTAEEYDTLVGYTAADERAHGFAEALELEEETGPKVRPKSVDPEFPEQWQDLYINFTSLDEYAQFMLSIGLSPNPKLKEFVYDPHTNEVSILDFF